MAWPCKLPVINRVKSLFVTNLYQRLFHRNFVEEKMGSKFVEGRSIEFSKSYEESSPSTAIFFILSPGVDPLKDVEALGKSVFLLTESRLCSIGVMEDVINKEHTLHCIAIVRLFFLIQCIPMAVSPQEES